MRGAEQRSQILAKRLRRRMTDAEIILWSRLRNDVIQATRFRRQHPIGPYIADSPACQRALSLRWMEKPIPALPNSRMITDATRMCGREVGMCSE